MDDQQSARVQSTIASWNEAAPLHGRINEALQQEVRKASFNNLNKDFQQLISAEELAGKSVLQLCCNNGIDLLSVKKQGAGRCVGIDGAEQFIAQAQQLAALAGETDMEFYTHNVYQLPERFQGCFDYVMLTVGVIYWMPDLAAFMQVCADLLRPGGKLLMEDIHPVVNMYEEGEPSYLNTSYFDQTPYEDSSGLDYFTGQSYQAISNYWYQHSLADVMQAGLRSGLELRWFDEVAQNIGNYCADLEHAAANPPLGFVASWQKSPAT